MSDENKALTARIKKLATALPRTHALLIGLAITAAFFALMLPSGEVLANRRPMPLVTDIDTNPQLALNTLTTPVLTAPVIADERPEPEWKEVEVRKGDSLGKLFERAGVSIGDMHDVLQTGEDAKTLKAIYPGQKLAFQLDQDGRLIALRYDETQLKSVKYYRDASGFVAEQINRDPEVHHQFTTGKVTSSLYKSGLDAGLSYNTILQLANIFSGEIDFALDIRPDDSFIVMHDEYYLDGKKIGDGPIVAASFTNQGQTYTAYRYIYANGDVGYFSASGESMRKTFMRAPLDFVRVSSPFNMHRLHPLFKTVRPHRGIDYAAPVGTPVYAAGDGRIVQSGYSPSNGNFVVIRHDATYTTKYLHLSKRYVKAGQRVKQHQVIGAVGKTGWATGPHLHYEFLVNGEHVNPAKIAKHLPKAKQIAASERRRFDEQVHGLEAQFAAYTQQRQPADASKLATDNSAADSSRTKL